MVIESRAQELKDLLQNERISDESDVKGDISIALIILIFKAIILVYECLKDPVIAVQRINAKRPLDAIRLIRTIPDASEGQIGFFGAIKYTVAIYKMKPIKIEEYRIMLSELGILPTKLEK